MNDVLGTRDGLYRRDGDDVTHVFGEGPVGVASGPELTIARAESSLYCERDDSWDQVDVPADDVTMVDVHGESIHVGGRDPLSLFTSSDSGRSWSQRTLPELSPATRWLSGDGPTVVDDAGGRIASVVDTGELLAVGVERAGVFCWVDGRWQKRSDGLHEDVHELLALDEQSWYATTGGGLYRTDSAGRRWRHVDTGQRFQQYTYYHGLAEHDGTVFVAGGSNMPGEWGPHGADCLVFRLEDGTLVEDDTPDPKEYVWCLASVDGDLYAGTVTQDLDQAGTAPGRLLVRDDGTWTPVVETPAGITSLG